MFVLHAAIKVKPGREEASQNLFAKLFKPAISVQPGFNMVEFLKPQDGGAYVLTIAFESQELQQKWVATDLHAQVWPKMEANFEGFTLKNYSTV
jgi:heme-degrading monooxygenase HmoA